MAWNRIGTLYTTGNRRWQVWCDGAHITCGHLHKSFQAARRCLPRVQKDNRCIGYSVQIACYEYVKEAAQ